MKRDSHRCGDVPGGWRVAACLAAAVAVSAAAPPAMAQEEVRKAEAERLLHEGADFIDKGEYAEALGRFSSAYKLYPSPKIHYNFGVAYVGLAREADAFEAFQRFLAEARNASADLRADADKRLAALGQRVATVEIACDVDGAEVTFDGRIVGTTPLPRPVHLGMGPHQYVVQDAATGAVEAGRFTAEGGKTQRIAVTLRKIAPPAMAQPQPAAAQPAAPVAQAAPASQWHPAPRPALPPPPPSDDPPGLFGRKPGAGTAQQPAAADTGEHPSRWWLWAGLGVVAVAAVATGVLLLSGKGRPSCPEGFSCQ